MNAWTQPAVEHTGRWISREYAELLATLPADAATAAQPPIEVLIVGSGYGGAVAAATLAGCGKRVVVLERGVEYLPGSFPARLAELPTQLRGRFAGQSRGGEGLFDLRLGDDISVVVANGLGGGSLINAGVMEVPDADAFARWPAGLPTQAALAKYFVEAKKLLGATVEGADNTIRKHPAHEQAGPLKQQVLEKLRKGGTFRNAAITVAMSQGHNTSGGVALNLCKRCGDCASGCNYGAKESLDTNLLVSAFRRGAEIYCGATVLSLAPRQGGGWQVQATYTDPTLRLREGRPRWIAAQRVILAAGTLGSTEILLRSQRDSSLRFSEQKLGSHFSGNGDMLVFGYEYKDQANALADEDTPPDERGIGPTITGAITTALRKKDPNGPRIVIEEMAVPAPLRRFAEEIITTANTLHALGEIDGARHRAGHPKWDPYAVQAKKIRDTSIFAIMGDDGADGAIELDRNDDSQTDGQVRVAWKDVGKREFFRQQVERLGKLAEKAKLGGRSIANPLWQLVPESMNFLIDGRRGPLLTVHPLGGCPMGTGPANGVVDEYGRVFRREALGSGENAHLYEGLVVLDGAIVPRALGTNPALTIAALALRAVEQLAKDWGMVQPKLPAPVAVPRPHITDIEARIQQRAAQIRTGAAKKTRAEFTERLSGPMTLRDADGKAQKCWVDVTLPYADVNLADLLRPDPANGKLTQAQLVLAPRAGREQDAPRLRIFLESDWKTVAHLVPNRRQDRRRIDALARIYELSGSLTILEREANDSLTRIKRAGYAWWENRGLRDLLPRFDALSASSGDPSEASAASAITDIWERIRGVASLASRAGEVRLFRYELRIGKEVTRADATPGYTPKAGTVERKRILGRKRITYARPSNPWRQLQELTLDAFPNLAVGAPVLSLDARFLATRATPLFRIVGQEDQARALADVAGLGMYFLRMLLSIHVWQLRKPDAPRPRRIDRLPPDLDGLRAERIRDIEVDRFWDQPAVGPPLDRPVHILLTRYRGKRVDPKLPPLLAIHGYSASGTTFAHGALDPSLAGYFAKRGRDVWVLDLRTSSDLPFAREPWTFERMALHDIPAAVAWVLKETGREQLDVVAHCMGAAMLSMAVLSADKELEEILSPRDLDMRDRFRAARRKLPKCIRKAVLSQVGPVLLLSEVNTLRAFVVSFFDYLFGPLDYEFRPTDTGLAGDLLDRLLSSLPYPDDELVRESPYPNVWTRTEFARSRHRMDALYGRTFKLGNVGDKVLDHLDDFFGPMSLDTTAQVRHLAQNLVVTNRGGRNRFVNHESLRTHWTFPTLSLHGPQNGLTDFGTLARMREVMEGGRPFETWDGAGEARGHQDSLIGLNAEGTFARIETFLRHVYPVPQPKDVYEFVARPPFLGPIITLHTKPDGSVVRMLSLGAAPQLGRPMYLCILPAVQRGTDWDWDLGRVNPGGGHTHHEVRALIQQPDTDWFTLPLPDWADDPAIDVPHIDVVLLYPQRESMIDRGFQPGVPGDTRDLLLLWSSRGLGAHPLVSRLRPVPFLPETEAQKDARHNAIGKAMGELQEDRRRAGAADPRPGLPAGILPNRVWVSEPKEELRLALGSCQYAAGILDQVPAFESWKRLGERCENLRTPAPDLLLLCGDQIYADASAGLLDPMRADDRYRRPHETWLQQVHVRDVLRRMPLQTLLDDHEIVDVWEPISPQAPADAQRLNERYLREGLTEFLRYQRPGDALADPPEMTPLWLKLQCKGIPLFLTDTRSQRDRRRAATQALARLMADTQLDALKCWLSDQPRELPKLIVSPSVLLPRHRRAVRAKLLVGADAGEHAALRSDSWDGYTQTWYELLGFIAANEIPRVLFLSGDEHLGLFCRAEITGTKSGKALQLWSIHTPGLYRPFPFANSSASDLRLNEEFQLPPLPGEAAGAGYSCKVETAFIEGSGFVLPTLVRQDGGWTLRCAFDDGAAPVEEQNLFVRQL